MVYNNSIKIKTNLTGGVTFNEKYINKLIYIYSVARY